MSRTSPLNHPPLPGMSLAFTVLLASCAPVGQPAVPPAAIEVAGAPELPAPPGDHLACPDIPHTAVSLPPAPYDQALGDCALVGKSADIEAWLTALEQIAAGCEANREANWAAALAAREALDVQVNSFEDDVPAANWGATLTARDDLDVQGDALRVDAPGLTSCGIYGDDEPLETLGPAPAPSHYYTDWLASIGENVLEYCGLIDELVTPLWLACDEINFYQDCQAPSAAQYHAIIASKMNAAQINYDATDFFYTTTLQTYGWGNFRLNFDEASLDCPSIQRPASIPTFVLTKNAFCRKGPGTAYPDVTAVPSGDTVEIQGISEDGSWYYVLWSKFRVSCWVSMTTGAVSGELTGVPVRLAPELPASRAPVQPSVVPTKTPSTR